MVTILLPDILLTICTKSPGSPPWLLYGRNCRRIHAQCSVLSLSRWSVAGNSASIRKDVESSTADEQGIDFVIQCLANLPLLVCGL